MKSKKSKFFFLQNLGPKIIQNDVIWSQEYKKCVFLTTKKNFKIFRFLDLENFQNFFKILVKILNFLNNFLQKVENFSPFS